MILGCGPPGPSRPRPLHRPRTRAGAGPTPARSDAYLDPDSAGFTGRVHRLLAATAQPATFAGYLAALEARRRYFIDHGAVSADHGVEEPLTLDLDPAEARRLFRAVLAGHADA